MSRYIDVEYLFKCETCKHSTGDKCYIYCETGESYTPSVAKFPSADVVEVVRCKDCKFWGIPHANDIEKSHYCCRDNMWCMPLRFADDYCSYGERSENDKRK